LGYPGTPFPDYPEIYQDPNESMCVPVCLKIVLEIMKKTVKGIPNLSIKKIANLIGTDADGTIPSKNIENINVKLNATSPQINFETDLGDIRWGSIKSDVHEENPLQTPVIALIGQYDTQEMGWMKHAVVILDAQDDYTFYWDPFYGPISEPTNLFFRKWDQLQRFCVRLIHIPRTQTLLEEYPIENRSENDESD